MPIVMKYGSPGPVLAAGYAAGAGSRMNKQKEDALKVWQQNTQREFQAQQSWLDRLQQSNLQNNAFTQQTTQAKLDREFQAKQQQNAFAQQVQQGAVQRAFQEGQTDKMLAFRAGESKQEADRRLADAQRHEQFLRDQATEVGLRRGELSLPPAAQAQLDKLEADSVEATKLDPMKKAEFMGKYEQRKRELYGMAKPTNQVPYDDRLRNSLGSNYEQYKDLPWQFNEQGERSLPAGFKMPADVEAQQQAATQKQITKYYDANRKAVDENNKPKFATPEDAMTAAMTEYQTVQGMLQGKMPEKPPEEPPSPQNIATYNKMQEMAAMGAQSWTTGPDTPPGGRVTMSGSTTQTAAAQPPSLPSPSSPDDFDRQWANLKPGESLRGPDGKLYTKRNK